MRILIDIGHPAHVHLFRPFAKEMENQGHLIIFTYRTKEFEKELLDAYGFKSYCIGKHYKSRIGKVFGLVKFVLLILLISLKFKPDICLSHGSMYAAQVSSLLRKPHISLEDTGNMEQIRFYLPFTETILTPDVLNVDLGSKQIRYKSFHELAYLLPQYFIPDRKIVENQNIKTNEKYAVIRFVSWHATHDKGQSGLTVLEIEKIIEYLSLKMKVLISSEGDLPVSLRKYEIHCNPQDIHHILAFAEIVISEGATMAAEAAVLGTPAIYINSIIACNNEELGKYGVVHNFRNGLGVLNKLQEMINDSDLKVIAKMGQQKLLSNKINLTEFLIWFVVNFPGSFRTLKENPNYQDRFKINFCE